MASAANEEQLGTNRQRGGSKGLTVYQAVQAAGGANEFGAMNRVVLWREGKKQIIDLEKAAGKAVVADVHDTIEVPEKNWRGR